MAFLDEDLPDNGIGTSSSLHGFFVERQWARGSIVHISRFVILLQDHRTEEKLVHPEVASIVISKSLAGVFLSHG